MDINANDVLPLVAAATGLIIGVLLGKLFSARVPKVGTWVAIAVILLGMTFGSQVTSWSINALIALGVAVVIAKYVSLTLLCLLSGVALAFVMNTKKPASQ